MDGCRNLWSRDAMAKKKRMTPAEQSARFREAAKEAGLDEGAEKFDAAFSKITSKKTVKAGGRRQPG